MPSYSSSHTASTTRLSSARTWASSASELETISRAIMDLVDWNDRSMIVRQTPFCSTMSYTGSSDSRRSASSLAMKASMALGATVVFSGRDTVTEPCLKPPSRNPTQVSPASLWPMVNSHLFRYPSVSGEARISSSGQHVSGIWSPIQASLRAARSGVACGWAPSPCSACCRCLVSLTSSPSSSLSLASAPTRSGRSLKIHSGTSRDSVRRSV
mmetsp:Transcript_1215/g.3721  ORF Transcript_1215/g.3721 Transcript_1215/m.3721 type:complete len:213 (-) Transcript_1215:454-1092(-)